MRCLTTVMLVLGLALGGCGAKDSPKPEQPPAPPAEQEAEAEASEVPGEGSAETERPEEGATAEAAEAAAAAAAAEGATAEERVAAVMRWIDRYNEGQVDAMWELATEDVELNVVGDPERSTYRGKVEAAQWARANRAMAPDVVTAPVRIIVAEPWVVSEAVVHGTHTGAPMAGQAEPSGQPFALYAAVAARFGPTGVDRVDVFVDQASFLSQIGVMPSPEGQRLAEIPEGDPEVIAAAASDGTVTTFQAWMAGLTRDEVAASGPRFLHDDFEYRDNAGLAIAGRDANVAFLEEKLFGMMPDWRVRALHVLSAGDWAVAWTKSQGTYAGGIPGVDADSQAVTMHRLEIAQLRDGKLALHRGYGNGLEAMAQLGLVGGAGGDKPEPEDVEQEAGLDEAEVELDAALEHVEGQLEALAEELDVELEVLQEEVAAELEGIEAELQAVDVDLDDEAEGD